MRTCSRLGTMGLALIGVIGAATRADAYVCTAALGCGYTGNHYATAAGDSGAVGYDSVAMGSGCWAYGTGAVAMGVESTATGGVSFAMGWYPTASGYEAVAMGEYVHAQALSEFVVGSYNVTDAGYEPNSWVDDDPLFVIGNGTGDQDRHNALTILKNGNTGINKADPEYPLQILGGDDAEPEWGGFVVAGSTASTNVAIDSNEIMARNNGATSTLYLNNDGGEVRVGGPLRVLTMGTASSSYALCSSGSSSGLIQRCPSSSRRYKDNIADFTLGLAEVQRLHPVSFTYRSSGQHSFGFIAEEVAEIYPDFAVYDEQGRPESVRYAEMTALLANAVQELSAETQELAATVKTQAVALSEQRAQLKAQASELAGLRASVAKQQLLLETLAADVARLSR